MTAALRLWAAALLLLLPAVTSLTAQELIRENIFRRLERGHKLLEDGKYAESLAVFETMRNMDLNSAEVAQLFQLMGFVQSSLNDTAGAIASFDRAVAANALPAQIQLRLRRNSVLMTAQLERWEEAIRRLRAYLPDDPEPLLDLYIVGAGAAAQLRDFESALGFILEAIRRSPEPKEPYYQSWAAFLSELNRPKEVAQVLEIMIRLFPNRDLYWKQLGNLYLQQQEDQKALGILALAYQRGFLTAEGDLRQLANLYLYLELPFRAAQVMDKGLKDRILTADFRNLDALARAYAAARENELAMAAFERSAPLDPTGETYFRLGQLHLENEDWTKAIAEFERAAAKGGLRNESNVWILLGFAHYQNDDLTGAIAAFEQAETYPNTEGTARQWLGHLREELATRTAEAAVATPPAS